MCKHFVVCFVLLLSLVAIDVQSKSFYRNGRELIVEDSLRQDSVPVNPVEVDVIQPVMIVKEEVLIPVETLQNVEQVAEVDEPEAISVEDGLRKDEEEGEETVDDDAEEQASEDEPVAAHPDDGLRGDPEEEIIAENVEEPQNAVEPNPIVPVVAVIPNKILKQGVAPSTTSRPSLIQQAQQIISNNPFGQFIDSIRNPSTKAPQGGPVVEQLSVESTTPVNIFQQLQQGVQSFGNQIGSQITSVLNPQANLEASESNPAETVVRPPNFFETIQSNFQNTVQGIFRPPGETGTQPGPFQSVLSNVQNFLAGNRPENVQQAGTPAAGAAASVQQIVSSDAPQKVGLPVDDKVDFTKNSGEIHEDPAVAETAQDADLAELSSPDGQIAHHEDESVVLVTSESELENDAE